MKILKALFACTALLIATATAQQSAQQPVAAKPTRAQKRALNSSASTGEAANTSHRAQAAPPIVIRGGKLLTISHGVIENGELIIERGEITSIGTVGGRQPLPTGAKVIDATGMTVYPGLIDSNTQLGLTEISADQMTNDLVETSDEIMPHMSVADAFHAESELIPVTRINGVTNAIVAPASRDTLPGQDSFIQLDGRDRDDMLLVRDIALPLNFSGDQRRNGGGRGSEGGGPKFPSTRMGMAAQLRQTFIDAQDYMQKWADYQKAPAAESKDTKDGKDAKEKKPATPPKRDLKLEALVPYLQGKKPVVLTAEESSDLKVAMQIAREFNLKVILCKVTYAQNMLDEIAASKLPVIVASIYETPKNGDRYDAEYSLPAELRKRGVRIAFASYDSHQVRNLPYQAGYAVAYGLPYDEALRAITLTPAEIWGVADKLGSLDVGKTANIVIANGDPLDVKTDVKQVFIAGREIPMVSRQTQLRDAYSKR